jgi:hypothetical protein
MGAQEFGLLRIPATGGRLDGVHERVGDALGGRLGTGGDPEPEATDLIGRFVAVMEGEAENVPLVSPTGCRGRTPPSAAGLRSPMRQRRAACSAMPL